MQFIHLASLKQLKAGPELNIIRLGGQLHQELFLPRSSSKESEIHLQWAVGAVFCRKSLWGATV
jgi:hypothetical protein